jgi:hypothetical protein
MPVGGFIPFSPEGGYVAATRALAASDWLIVLGAVGGAWRSVAKPHRRPVSGDAQTTRAYEIYLERGGVDGLDEKDWFQAEKELGDGLKSRGQKA